MDPKPITTQSFTTSVCGYPLSHNTTPANSQFSPHLHQTPRLVPSYDQTTQRALPGLSWLGNEQYQVSAQSPHTSFTAQASSVSAHPPPSSVQQHEQTPISYLVSLLIDQPAFKTPGMGGVTDYRKDQPDPSALARQKSPPSSSSFAPYHSPDQSRSHQPPAYRYRTYTLRERGAVDKGKGRAVERGDVSSDGDERKAEAQESQNHDYGSGTASQSRTMTTAEPSALIMSASSSRMPAGDSNHPQCPTQSTTADTSTLPPMYNLQHYSMPGSSNRPHLQDAWDYARHGEASGNEPRQPHEPYLGGVYPQTVYDNSYPYQSTAGSSTSSTPYGPTSHSYHGATDQYGARPHSQSQAYANASARPSTSVSLHSKAILAYQAVFDNLVQECHYTAQSLHYTPFQAYMARAWDQYEAGGRKDAEFLMDKFEIAVRGDAAKQAELQLQSEERGYEGNAWRQGDRAKASPSGLRTAYDDLNHSSFQQPSSTFDRYNTMTTLQQQTTIRSNFNPDQCWQNTDTAPESLHISTASQPFEAERQEKEQAGTKNAANERRKRRKARAASLGPMNRSHASTPPTLICGPKRRRASQPHPSISAPNQIKLLSSQAAFRSRFNWALDRLNAEGAPAGKPVYLGGVHVRTLEDALGGQEPVRRWSVEEVERIARMVGVGIMFLDKDKDGGQGANDGTPRTANDARESKNERHRRKNAFRWFRKSLMSVYVANGGKEAFDRYDEQMRGARAGDGREAVVGGSWDAFNAEVEEMWARVTRDLAHQKE
ncbi:hypothetical protein IAR50_003176 [Cryptococcus sp. DSM 104548]